MIFEAIRSGAWAALSNKAKAIYATICYFVEANGGICSVRRLACHAGVSRRGTIQGVRELIAASLIMCRKGTPFEPSQFELVPPPVTRILDQQPSCTYCGRPSTVLDHVIPQSEGGLDDPENLVPCCFRCNTLKGALSYGEFIAVTERIMWEERDRQLGRVGELPRSNAPTRIVKRRRIRLITAASRPA
jgi:5-methylcytosine-specific restriction endonuclease McrA